MEFIFIGALLVSSPVHGQYTINIESFYSKEECFEYMSNYKPKGFVLSELTNEDRIQNICYSQIPQDDKYS